MVISPDDNHVFVALGAGGTMVVPFTSGNTNPLSSTATLIGVVNTGGSALSVAVEVEVILVDDIDGSEATETVRFGLDGTSYEIDLNAANAAALRNALARFTGAGRKAGRTRRTAAANGRKAPDADLDKAEVRNWARANGVKVNERGRVPDAVVARYRAAHGG